jgi:hypothetical protein
VAALVVMGIWDGVKKRETQHETLRRMLESGKPVDEALLTRLMGGEVKRPDRELVVAAIVVFSIAAGLGVLAAFLSGLAPKAVMPLLGAAGICACLAGGFLVASAYVRRARVEDEAPARDRPHAS